MKIALAPYSLRGYRGAPTSAGYKEGIKSLLYRVRSIGYDGIEMATPQGFTTQEYKDYVDEIGLQVITVGGQHSMLAEESIAGLIAQCKTLGAQNVMIGSMPNSVLGNPYELKRFIATLNRAGAALIGEGIHLSYHNHAVDFSRINGVTILEQIVEGTDPRHVFIEPDTHWLQAGGAHVITWLKKLRGRIFMVHFKDYGIDPYSDHAFLEGTHKQFKEIGEGNLNWPGILQECHDQGIAWCATEQDDTQRPVYEALELGLRNLRALGA